MIIDDWRDHAAYPENETQGSISLVRGVKYNIRMEYYEAGGDASARLFRSCHWLDKEIVPARQLYSGTGTPTTPPEPTSTPGNQTAL